MPNAVKAYVRFVDALNRAIGGVAIYLLFLLGAILLASTLSRLFTGAAFNWALEMSQFVLSAYYLLGGAYAVQQDSHVRMDVFYGRLSAQKRAVTDALTILFVIFYLIVLLAGGISSTHYAIVYKQQNYSAWSPLLWPIKVIMSIGVFLMLLQCISTFFKNVATARGRPIA